MYTRTMGLEAEPDHILSTPRLLLFSKPHTYAYVQSPERPGMLTSPLHTSASVPFRWEEEPGKPRQCTALSNTIDFPPKCLELPPRLLMESNSFSKLPSPTAFLEGPYIAKTKFQSSSFRINRREWYGSFRRTSFSPERRQLGTIVLRKIGLKEKGILGSWSWGRGFKGKREVGGGSYVFPSSLEREAFDAINIEEEDESGKKVDIGRIKRSGSFSILSHARPQFWLTIYEGLKQVVPWRSKKVKKDGFVSS